jgi:hypothetical protein
MRANLQELKDRARDAKDLNGYIDNILNNQCSPDDPPYLSDLIVGFNQGGVFLMEALGEKFVDDVDMPDTLRFKWHLQVLRDEWGNPPNPGDVVTRRIQKPHKHGEGKPCTADEINFDIMNGEYEKKWIKKIPFEVDKKGCITVGFSTAVSLLRQFGIHGKSGHNMSIHVVEHSGDPVPCPDGQMRHVWYRRFKEVDKEEYSKLPEIQVRTEKKRGIQ